MSQADFSFSVPDWVAEINGLDIVLPELEKRAEFVIDASQRNAKSRLGGPFAAGIFEIASGRLVALGVNLVTSQACCVLHGEVVAIMLAQRKVGTYDFSQSRLPPVELVSSTEPCAMCYGTVPWSGVRRLVCCARADDAIKVGFDEGHKGADWVSALQGRGIEVVRDIRRDQAVNVLADYGRDGGQIYNGRQ